MRVNYTLNSGCIMNGQEQNNKIWKEKILVESRKFLFLTLFLTLFSCSLTIFRSMILHDDSLSYFHYGYNLFESMILAKMIMVGQYFKIGDRFLNRSLIIPTLYKASVFCIFVLAFTLLEHILSGIILGKDLNTAFYELLNRGLGEIFGRMIICFIVFIMLFSFLEIDRVLGNDKLFKLFFQRKNQSL